MHCGTRRVFEVWRRVTKKMEVFYVFMLALVVVVVSAMGGLKVSVLYTIQIQQIMHIIVSHSLLCIFI